MSKISVDQKTIKDLFQDKKTDFLIPDYQRPYDWGENECGTLWDDIFEFAIPDQDYEKFDNSEEYFLGPIVVFKNEEGKQEVIDGQQRLTSLMLLLRAFYEAIRLNEDRGMKDERAAATRKDIEQCIWKTDEFGKADKERLKIDSQVATDEHKEEFLTILRTGKAPAELQSNYARMYRFFQGRVQDFIQVYPSYIPYLPTRTMKNCVLLPVEGDSRDTALRIFSTLNDRGKPLSDADIFKAQFYKHFAARNQKDEFVRRWKKLEQTCRDAFGSRDTNAVDELFMRYMHYLRSVQDMRGTTTEALRKFYERNNYALLAKDTTLPDLEALADFWNAVQNADAERFSEDNLKRLFILNYAPNNMWTQAVSVYFLANRSQDGSLDDVKLGSFLDSLTAFLLGNELLRPGTSALRTPLYRIMRDIAQGRDLEMEPFSEAAIRRAVSHIAFTNSKRITRSMITWWAFQEPGQSLLPRYEPFQIEHIYPTARMEKEKSLSSRAVLELLGNKALLEKNLNGAASDYRFSDRRRIYDGTAPGRRKRKPTQNAELLRLAAAKNDFTEQDIFERDSHIISSFISYLRQNALLKT